MSVQSDIANIKAVVEGVDDNRVATLAYTETAFNSDDVDGVETFNVSAEQNIPLATKTDFNATVLGKGLRSQASSIPRNAMNHFLGRVSYNLNKLVQKFLSFLTIDAAARAHNANEYDADALYLPGDICYVVADDGTIYTRTYYRRIGAGSTTGIAVTDTSYWKESVAKYGGEHRRYTVADLTGGSYNTSTFYPVVTALQDMQAQIGVAKDPVLRVEVEAFCNGAVAGWTNAQRAELRVRSKLTGFAATSTDIVEDNSCIDQTNGTDNSASTPIRFTKLPLGRQVVLWLKGGAKYALWNSFGSAFTLYTTTYNNGLDAAIAPTTSISSVFTRAPVVMKASDAELLDGIDSTRMVFGDNAYASTLITDANTPTKSGLYRCTATAANIPTDDFYVIWQISFDQNACVQLAVSTSTAGNFYVRQKLGGTFQSWEMVWNSANDDDGSGLDADTVDGIHSERIVYGDNWSGTRAPAAGPDTITKSGFYRCESGSTYPEGNTVIYVIHVQYPFSTQSSQQICFSTAGGSWVRFKHNYVWGAWLRLWSAGNVGTNWPTALGAPLGTGWTTAFDAALGTNWTTALETALGTGWTTALAAALGSGWTTALAAAVNAGGRDLLGLSALGTNWATALAAGATFNTLSGSWVQKGSALPISGVSIPALAALNSTTVAFIDSENDQLRTYRWNGSAWSLVGSGLSISGTNYPALAALDSTTVAFIDSGNKQLRTYRWNGSAWSLVGSALSISGVGYHTLAALNSTTVAFFDSGNDQLRTYSWSGSAWSLVGSALSISGVSVPALAALNSTTVAFFDDGNDQLRTYGEGRILCIV